jgi:transcriptional regulator with XRE-family HTH domain
MEAAGVSVSQLAKEVGVSYTTVLAWINATRHPRILRLTAIDEALNPLKRFGCINCGGPIEMVSHNHVYDLEMKTYICKACGAEIEYTLREKNP